MPPQIVEIDLKKFLIEAATEAATNVAFQVTVIDEVLSDVDYLLNDLQPALTGKIRIVWGLREGLVRPRPVVYRRSKSDGRWKYDVIGIARLPVKAKTRMQFHDNSKIVKELLSVAQVLMEMRGELIREVRWFRKATADRYSAAGKRTVKFKELLGAAEARRDAGEFRRFSQDGLAEEYRRLEADDLPEDPNDAT